LYGLEKTGESLWASRQAAGGSSIVGNLEETPPGIDFEETKRILKAMEREGVRYVLIGAMAMAAQRLVRATVIKEAFKLEED
jgi:hypothetical protein